MSGPSGRPVGRPNKEPATRRVHKVSTYLSASELKRLNEQLAASGMALADWLRNAISARLDRDTKNNNFKD